MKKELEELKDNTEFLREVVSSVNSQDGSLESYEVHEFDDDFFNNYFADNPSEAVRATFFGDLKSWNDEYIRFNGYGNLESVSDFDYRKELEKGADEIIERAEELSKEIELKEIIKRYEA